MLSINLIFIIISCLSKICDVSLVLQSIADIEVAIDLNVMSISILTGKFFAPIFNDSPKLKLTCTFCFEPHFYR
jgi:hypothetical protein